MNFDEYVRLQKPGIYETICKYVPISDQTENSSRIMRVYVDRQGSYRRPGLLMLTGQLFGAMKEDLLLPAAAQQLSEDWILMQDDIEDGSELRRGKPAIQRLPGIDDSRAFNATNIGQMAMWRMLNDYALEHAPDKGKRIYEKFYHMLSLTVEGQDYENNFIHNVKSLGEVDESFYFEVVEAKTCYYTVYGPMQIGALVAGQEVEVLEALEALGRPAGVAFQIRDDMLDMIADEKEFGKKRYGDLYEGKLTLMALHAFDRASPGEKERMNGVYAKTRERKDQSDIGFLVDMIEKYDGIGYAKEKGEKYAEEAEQALEWYDKLFPDNAYKPILESAIRGLFVRSK